MDAVKYANEESLEKAIADAKDKPLAGRAQQSEPMRRIAVLTVLAENDPENKARLGGFKQGLEGLGWSESRNAHMDHYFGGTGDAEAFASAVLASQPDVIFVQGTPFTTALQHRTHTIPIVFVGVADPVGSGFIASLARPGGNLTGFMLYEASVAGKWLAMLKEIAPQKPDCRKFWLLRARHERPPCRPTAEQRYELTPFQPIKLHAVPRQPWRGCRIPISRRSVSGYAGRSTTGSSWRVHLPSNTLRDRGHSGTHIVP
jgi:ABC transporter substrate binding protein